MSYTPTEWQNGDVISSEKLNKMEQGIADAGGSSGGGVLCLGATSDSSSDNPIYTLDKTWQEIHDAVVGGAYIFVRFYDDYYETPGYSINPVQDVIKYDDGTYVVSLALASNFPSSYTCLDPDDYPNSEEPTI